MTRHLDLRRALAEFCAREHGAQTRFLAELVRCRPTTRRATARAMPSARPQLLEGLGFTVERHPVPERAGAGERHDQRTNLIVRERFGDGPVVALNAHGDVVPPGEGWTTIPTAPRSRTAGCTAAASRSRSRDFATYAFALLALKALGAGRSPARSSCTSPTTRRPAARSGRAGCSSRASATPDFAIGAGFSYAVVTAHNGCLHLEVLVTGRSAHAAMP